MIPVPVPVSLRYVLHVLTVDFCGQMELQGISISGVQDNRTITKGRTACRSMQGRKWGDGGQGNGMIFHVISRKSGNHSIHSSARNQ